MSDVGIRWVHAAPKALGLWFYLADDALVGYVARQEWNMGPADYVAALVGDATVTLHRTSEAARQAVVAKVESR